MSGIAQPLHHANPRCAVRARRPTEITRRLDALFADPALAQEQHRTAAQLDAAGSSWNDERW
jgi:hypothetical protein